MGAPAMKAMKKAGATGLTATAAFTKVAESTELKSKQVKAVVTSYLELAAGELKKNGKFKLGGLLNMKLKKKPAVAARKGVNPFTKEPCVFKAKPASKTVRVLPMKKFKEAINWFLVTTFHFRPSAWTWWAVSPVHCFCDLQ